MNVPRRSNSRHQLLSELTGIVGRKHVLTSDHQTRRFRKGYRFGDGDVLAVVRPGSLVEQWRVLQACVATNTIVIMQAANTGLTGGSTPDGAGYDRDVVVINTLRIDRIDLIDEGRQVICLPGATLNDLEKRLRPVDREPHSVIGSSCVGATVMGGICNNSGGALVRRGPAYTELALFAQLDEIGSLRLINHLGVDLGSDPETILGRLDRMDYAAENIAFGCGHASDHAYANQVRDVEADSPARYNADPHRLYEASGSAGRLAVFAVRLDTFPRDAERRLFYIGTNDLSTLTCLRRHILTSFGALPVLGEYLHRDAFDIAEKYGKDTFFAILWLGAHRLPTLFAWKSRFDSFFERFRFLPTHASDRLLQWASTFLPRHLPKRLDHFRSLYDHHLLLEAAGPGIEETRSYLAALFDSADGACFECTEVERERALLHRFVTAGAAIRYRAIHSRSVEDIIAIDVALRRNDTDWFESLPREIDESIWHKLYYGHFFCHVFHQDYVVRKGADCAAIEERMLALLDQRGAEYPAEHNVGHHYTAKADLVAHYRALDPCNAFNPGIGHTTKVGKWNE
ncbi:D-lactate dehydrogenase [Sphingomonas sp. LaA6.9]|uniref:D-lactate dehydrogenase n=1 Tax=Sphingomonas sp. LaA6.9 TaxID=2919914 RepID=UPI001F4FC60E|nr:D-lactate dehydrogenase [Sphingomonas sp. LaA6.9]MCJ8159024.1 D-lactate dehydrogenase [Sphingomonas sp. LaA6.9]